jgi:hypothetical protein
MHIPTNTEDEFWYVKTHYRLLVLDSSMIYFMDISKVLDKFFIVTEMLGCINKRCQTIQELELLVCVYVDLTASSITTRGTELWYDILTVAVVSNRSTGL